jgi:hypothetical protein
MRRFLIQTCAVIAAIALFMDAIDGDIMIAGSLNRLAGTHLSSIARDPAGSKAGSTIQLDRSISTASSVTAVALDEDSPSTLDTSLPTPSEVLPLPAEPAPALSIGHVPGSRLILSVLLI